MEYTQIEASRNSVPKSNYMRYILLSQTTPVRPRYSAIIVIFDISGALIRKSLLWLQISPRYGLSYVSGLKTR